MTFQPSPFQQAFFTELRDGTSSILLNAGAGSGKSTTILHGCTIPPTHLLIIILAFNKKIADAMANRVPLHIKEQVGTFHSRAWKALRRSLAKNPKYVGEKAKDKIRDILKKNILKYSDFELYNQYVCKLVSLAKSAGLFPDSPESSWQELIAHFALTAEGPDFDELRAIRMAQGALEENNADLSQIMFDDMLYLPYVRNTQFDKASYIFVDEAQDTNAVQRALLHKMLAPDGRLIAVGDPYQSIYGFRGADASAMSLLQSEFSMLELPLSICYRCSQSVVREAQKYLN